MSRTQTYTITSASFSKKAAQQSRVKFYLLSMTIRTACFLGAIFTHGWIRWAAVVAAVVLPYIAVVVANSQSAKPEKLLPFVANNNFKKAVTPTIKKSAKEPQ